MLLFLSDCRVIDQVYDICKEHNFDELDESRDWITIEYVGDYEWIKSDDYDMMSDYYKATREEYEKKIKPKFLELWENLQEINGKYNIFKGWEWYDDDYMCFDLSFTEEFKEKLFSKKTEED